MTKTRILLAALGVFVLVQTALAGLAGLVGLVAFASWLLVIWAVIRYWRSAAGLVRRTWSRP